MEDNIHRSRSTLGNKKVARLSIFDNQKDDSKGSTKDILPSASHLQKAMTKNI